MLPGPPTPVGGASDRMRGRELPKPELHPACATPLACPSRATKHKSHPIPIRCTLDFGITMWYHIDARVFGAQARSRALIVSRPHAQSSSEVWKSVAENTA